MFYLRRTDVRDFSPVEMDDAPMDTLETFRQQTRAWLLEHAPESLMGTRGGRFDGYWGGRKSTEDNPDVLRWRDVMVERGWSAPTWPRAYGGGGLSDDEADILEALLIELKLPPPVVGFGLTMIGPTLLHYGTEAQKKLHLPRICRGEVRWCQGYSEPGAGSDLASLQTRGVVEGDQLRIHGQKVWTSYANLSDWIFCLVRTDPKVKKQAGISFVLIDMETDGVSTRPIPLISGASPFCETFLEDVIVPLDHVIGGLNNGWTVAKALMGFERSMIGSAVSGQMRNSELALASLAKKAHGEAPEGRLTDAVLRDEIAAWGIRNTALGFTAQRIGEAAEAGQKPGPESSIMKLAGTSLKQQRFEINMKIRALDATGWDGEGFSSEDIQQTRDYLRSRANTIEGGSSEIQRNVIAKRVLGLPTT